MFFIFNHRPVKFVLLNNLDSINTVYNKIMYSFSSKNYLPST